MSFLKKLTKEFDGLKTNFLKDDNKKGEKKEEKKEGRFFALSINPPKPILTKGFTTNQILQITAKLTVPSPSIHPNPASQHTTSNPSTANSRSP